MIQSTFSLNPVHFTFLNLSTYKIKPNGTGVPLVDTHINLEKPGNGNKRRRLFQTEWYYEEHPVF